MSDSHPSLASTHCDGDSGAGASDYVGLVEAGGQVKGRGAGESGDAFPVHRNVARSHRSGATLNCMFASPIGCLRFVASERGLSRVCFAGERLPIDDPSDHPLATQQLTEYFAGTRREFTVPLDLTGVTEFRAAVLRELARVPYGGTTTYAQLARAVGNPKAVRAVGSACATNPLPLFIPCHRVLRSDGALGGYRGGVEAKRYLLNMEGVDV